MIMFRLCPCPPPPTHFFIKHPGHADCLAIPNLQTMRIGSLRWKRLKIYQLCFASAGVFEIPWFSGPVSEEIKRCLEKPECLLCLPFLLQGLSSSFGFNSRVCTSTPGPSLSSRYVCLPLIPRLFISVCRAAALLCSRHSLAFQARTASCLSFRGSFFCSPSPFLSSLVPRHANIPCSVWQSWLKSPSVSAFRQRMDPVGKLPGRITLWGKSKETSAPHIPLHRASGSRPQRCLPGSSHIGPPSLLVRSPHIFYSDVLLSSFLHIDPGRLSG